MLFSEVLSSLQRDGDQWAARIPADWMIGRTAFGGLQAAFAARAMREVLPDTTLPLRTLQCTFLAPVSEGALTIKAQVLRTGKNAVHAQARLIAGDQVLALVIGVFGAARESSVLRLPAQQPVESAKPIEFRYIPGVTPVFTQHFRARWLLGGLPYSNATLPRNVVEVGLDETGRANDGHVLALADFIPPVAMSFLKKPAAGGTLIWMMEFFSDRHDHLPLSGWRVDADLVAAVGGYTSQSVMLWGPGGEPVAISRQSMVIFS
ncbi:MAG: thioesterase family protein [Pseudomonadota bacterium]